MTVRRLRVGDEVRVRTPQEILATLENDGTLDSLPFMPEMVDWCGKTFRVQRRAEKTCVDGYPARRFTGNDVVVLDGPRCDGQAHDGCKHGCRIYWKEAWLQPLEAGSSAPPASAEGLEELRARLRVKLNESRYFCQSTELFDSTEAFPRSQRFWTLRIPYREIRSGDISIGRFAALFARWLWQRTLRALGCDRRLRGTLKRTPNESLGLKPGERVRVKTREQILQTLDHHGRNRGLGICYEMTRCCGLEAEVRSRVDFLVDERTGVMRKLYDTVTLQNIGNRPALAEECLCSGQLGDCPRGELMYWREIWLERVERADDKTDMA